MDNLKKFLFHNINTRQTIIKNTFWLFTGEAVGRLLKMGLIIYAARKLGANGWGVFAYTISTASLLMTFSDIGIGSLITRDATQKKENYRSLISAALLLKIIILVISIILVIFVSPYISSIQEANILFPIIGIVFLFDSLRDIGFAVNRIFEKMEKEMVVKVVMNLSILILGVILIKINPLPISVGIAYAVGSALSVVLILIILRKSLFEFITKTNFETLKLVLKTTLPLAIITLVSSIMANTDIYMLGLWKSPEDIGIYSAAQRFYQFVLIVPSMIGTATLPLMSRLANTDNEKFKNILEKTLYVFMIICIPITFGGLILANQIIPLVFGPEYLEAIPVLQILMLMLLVSFPIILLINAIFVYNKQSKLVFINILGVLANVFLNFLLIPKFGVTGAAIATLISSTIVTSVIWVKMKKINHFEILPSLKKIFMPTLIMILATLSFQYLGIHVLLNIFMSAIIYLFIIFIKEKSLIEEMKGIMRP